MDKKVWIVSWLSINERPEGSGVDTMVFEDEKDAKKQFEEWCIEAKLPLEDGEIKNEYTEQDEEKEQKRFVLDASNYTDIIAVESVKLNKQAAFTGVEG